MFEVVFLGLFVAALVLLSFSVTALEGWVVPRWRRRGGPNRMEDWQVRHFEVAAVGILVAYAVIIAWALRNPFLAAVMAAVTIGQHRSLARLHRRWHAGEYAVQEPAR
jgi:hypothetical protein